MFKTKVCYLLLGGGKHCFYKKYFKNTEKLSFQNILLDFSSSIATFSPLLNPTYPLAYLDRMG